MTNRINKKITISAVSALLITVMLLLVLSTNVKVDETVTPNTVWDQTLVVNTYYAEGGHIPCYVLQ